VAHRCTGRGRTRRFCCVCCGESRVAAATNAT
jgi:hypothetical protein